MLKKVGIGCGIVTVLMIVALVVAVPKMIRSAGKWMEAGMAQEEGRRQLAQRWRPPVPGAPPAMLFPAKVGEARLASRDERSAIPELGIDLEGGRHAVYRQGAEQIDVFAYRASELEAEALFKRVQGLVESAQRDLSQQGYGSYGSSSSSDLYARCRYVSSAHGQNHLWWVKGWLFVFRTRALGDREPFATAFLDAVGKAGAAADAAPADVNAAPRGAPAAPSSGGLVGTWRMASHRYGQAEKPTLVPEARARLKHFTPTHFLWLSRDPRTGDITEAGGGTYSLRGGGAYTEQIQYGLGPSYKAVRGKEQSFTCEVDGEDTLRQRGTLSNGLTIEETWQRVGSEDSVR